MTDRSRLLDYVLRRQDGGFGWKATYDRSVSDNSGYLAGHYSGMLDDLIDAVGADTVLRLVDAHDRIRKRIVAQEAKAKETTHD